MFSNPEQIIEQFKIGEGMSVGDFGVGSGAYTLEAARRVGEYGRVYAFDIQEELLKRVSNTATQKGISSVHILSADLETPHATTLPDGELDAAIVANILFQIENKKVFMTEVARVLRGGGKLLLVDWSESFGGLGPQTDQVVSKAAAGALASEAGLTFEGEVPAGDHHYGLVFRKPKE